MFSQSQTINNLREARKKLEDKLKAVKNWINEQPECIRESLKLKELEEILGGKAQSPKEKAKNDVS